MKPSTPQGPAEPNGQADPADAALPQADAAPAGETPMQRALRLKNAALAAKPAPPRGGRFQRERAAAAHSSSKSKPWMSR